ncbi:major facilitator superfamily domain-containing protein [Parachaetomium inaequale]|uniref:Major facilitator superfamily domain-containing protein n=1 Tax=Parachaetomium inaequale TaxID=2588326 RepID=A0AAN6PFC5_9PEZI|nr:major facilitator superfamily domain-containing protein [Parachaetomium inaequale]
MSSFTASKILIFGGTGTIGRYITTALLRAKPAFQQLVLFTSPNSAKEKAQQLDKWKSEGLSIIVGDLTSEEDVKAAYNGVDTVISAVGRGGLQHQIKLLQLAEASESVKWFLPSEFGTDIEHNNKSPNERPHQLKLQVRKYIRENLKRVKVTYVVTGPYFDMWVDAGSDLEVAGGFVPEKKQAYVIEDGNGKVGFCTMPDVGKFVAATLKSPEASFGKALKVQSFVVTPNEVLAEYERQTGAKWEVTKTPLDEIRAFEAKLWEEGNPRATLVTLRRIWAEGGTLYAQNDNSVLASKLEDLDSLEAAAELNAPQDVITCQKKSVSFTQKLLSIGSKTSSTASPDCIPMTPASFAAISAVFTVGGLIGALAAGPFTSRRGRRLSMQATALFYLLGSAIETFAASVPIMIVARFLTGIGAGASTVIVPLYISEVAPPAKRGFFGAFTQISINVGILFTQTLGYFMSHDSAWRWIFGTGVILALAQGLGLLVVPESPAWTANVRGDVAHARRALQRIRGKNSNIDEEVEAWGAGDGKPPGEQERLLAAEDAEAAEAGAGLLSPSSPGSRSPKAHLGFVQVVRDPLYRPAIIAVVGIMFAQQLCGINSIIMYSVSLLNGLLPISSALVTIVISVINLGTTIAASPLPDRFGRKTCLLTSIIGQGSSSLALALAIRFGFKIMSAVAVLLFVAFFALGLGPVPFIMASELVGPEAVGATQSWALGASYIATFLVAYLFPIVNQALNDALGGAGWVYFIFAAFALLWAGFVTRNVPETRGKRDADEVWGRTRRTD